MFQNGFRIGLERIPRMHWSIRLAQCRGNIKCSEVEAFERPLMHYEHEIGSSHSRLPAPKELDSDAHWMDSIFVCLLGR